MDMLVGLLPFIVIIGAMWLFMVRPQKKRQEETQKMLDSLQKGDAIVTIGGLHGVVDEVLTKNNTVVIDCEGIYLTFERRAIARIITKAEGAASTSTEELGTNTPEETQESE